MLLYVLALSDFIINSRQGATLRGLQARAPSGRRIAVYILSPAKPINVVVESLALFGSALHGRFVVINRLGRVKE